MQRVKSIAVLGLATGLVSCATLFGGGSNQAINISSTPAPATFTVKSSSGLQMAQGTTPTVARLPRKNEYQIEITAPGYVPQNIVLTKGINGWFWANLVLGGVIGMAIDFASGAAWKLEPSVVSVNLQRGTGEDAGSMFSRIQLFNENGKLLSERLLKLEPAR